MKPGVSSRYQNEGYQKDCNSCALKRMTERSTRVVPRKMINKQFSSLTGMKAVFFIKKFREAKNMLGMADGWITLAFVLMVLSMITGLGYGAINWNNGDDAS